MFEEDQSLPVSHSYQDGSASQFYREEAQRLEQEGAKQQAWYLLMASYEAARTATNEPFDPEHPAIGALRRAWDIAIELEDSHLAEQTYRDLEEYLSFEEADAYMARFQELDANRLGRFGIAMNEMGEVAAALSERLIGRIGEGSESEDALSETTVAMVDEAQKDPRGFDRLVGFDAAIAELRTRGFGVQNNPEYLAFIEQMNAQHGLEYHPSRIPLLIRADARSDANRLMLAIAEELELPVIRMRMDPGPQGDPVLSVMTTLEPNFKNSLGIPGHSGPGVLILEDIDQWYFPTEGDQGDEFGYQSLTRAARKAMAMIGASAAQSEVTVLASVSADAPLDGYMFELLEPFDVIEVYEPTASEREAVWEHLVSRHNSLSTLDKPELVRLSAHMPRADIFGAAREAIEQAYREGLEARRYLPVSLANILDKIAAYQPLDSDEYKAIEQILVEELMDDISSLERDGINP